jgi:hypothetical protein
MIEILLAQMTDPFRIALAVGLVLTMIRTRSATGTALPLAAGILFIAVIIPTTLQSVGAGLVWHIGLGLVSTTVIVAIVLAIREAVLRFR